MLNTNMPASPELRWLSLPLANQQRHPENTGSVQGSLILPLFPTEFQGNSELSRTGPTMQIHKHTDQIFFSPGAHKVLHSKGWAQRERNAPNAFSKTPAKAEISSGFELCKLHPWNKNGDCRARHTSCCPAGPCAPIWRPKPAPKLSCKAHISPLNHLLKAALNHCSCPQMPYVGRGACPALVPTAAPQDPP